MERDTFMRAALTPARTEEARELLIAVINIIPEPFFTDPASVRDYHGERDGEGGLACHSLEVASIAIVLMPLYGISEANALIHDLLLCAGVLHDTFKRINACPACRGLGEVGIPDRFRGGVATCLTCSGVGEVWGHTCREHGFIAGDRIERIGGNSDFVKAVAVMVCSHMTWWGDPSLDMNTLSREERIIAHADYLSAQSKLQGWGTFHID